MVSNKSVNNSTYITTHKTGASVIKRLLWYVTSIVFFKNPLFVFSGIKCIILRSFGSKIGKGVVIKPCVNIKYPWKLRVGNYTWVGEDVWIDNLCEVTIGSNVCISQGALLLTGSHDHTKTSFDFLAFPIQLEDGVWIGAKSLVTGGVVCRSHSILGANSIAESNLKPYSIYKGNPAIVVQQRVIC